MNRNRSYLQKWKTDTTGISDYLDNIFSCLAHADANRYTSVYAHIGTYLKTHPHTYIANSLKYFEDKCVMKRYMMYLVVHEHIFIH